ncbi:MAG: hypothetical protein A3C93_00505 [Candidatus Lloydbacteria bacterium RIFCSPHIGHO2_02_FULL_54_17]|uniref:Fibronectin type-III domain-containing protein n=1 Tax=Candidatus Lloydbacteria bacterium RIFCSPHIGHO2_02_FULL_54_17 TaxID=1798664 RepID=A0A1G2DHV9_9BACT|nr:MAG: hypothetical protein A2762_05175 [Candidatus Lloydbacteria bacterium RIFCSPHIGHO2_01_FULL_54_11]OGZ12398.1 MAG: hypothetical protein A3C93_00505 [Candidatus Lloydbacteria bacterium RIFCSPHIGHO2_02_FULL_54_17]
MSKAHKLFAVPVFVLILSLFLAVATASATDYTSPSFMVKDPVLFPAAYSTSTGYILISTMAQISIGTSTATTGSVRELRSGFEYFPFVTRPVLSAVPGSASVSLSWSASVGILGWTVSGYSVGQSLTSGGPYTFTGVGLVTVSTAVGLVNGTTYYFVVAAQDAFGNFIATSTEVSATPVAGVTPPTPGGGGGGGGYVPPPVIPPIATTTPPVIIPPLPPVVVIPPITVPPSGICHTIADLNCDGYVDIIDFSIMYYWFERTNIPTRVDLRQDGRVDLADFSVMAAYWYERPRY